MSISIKELREILIYKGGATSTSEHLIGLATLVNNLSSARTNTLPADTGQVRTGVSCSAHIPVTYSDVYGVSLQDILNQGSV